MVRLSGNRPGIDEGFGDALGFRFGQCGIESIERVGPFANRAPRHFGREPFQKCERPKKVPGFTAPAPADVQVLAVDRLMHIDRARPGIGVMARDDVPSTVASQEWTLFKTARGS